MIPIQANTYRATTFADHAVPYRCVHCHYEGLARVFAYAAGTGASPYGIDDAGAERRALRRASANADAQARANVALAPCPRCRRRDRRAVIAAYRSPLLQSIAIIALSMAAVALMDQAWQIVVVLGGAMGLAFAALWWKYRTAQLGPRGVRFDA